MPFKTIHITDLPPDAHLIKEQLELEEIAVRLLDEDKPDLNYEYSPEAGVKIQVQESDLKKARSILLRHGYIDLLESNSTIVTDIYEFTKNIPIVKNWKPEIRLISFVIMCVGILFAIIFSMYDF